MAATASARVVGEVGQRHRLAALDLLDDGEQQLVAGPEVVDEHPVAGADGVGDLAQRPAADPVAGEGLDEAVEQFLAPPVVRRSRHPGSAARSSP